MDEGSRHDAFFEVRETNSEASLWDINDRCRGRAAEAVNPFDLGCKVIGELISELHWDVVPHVC